MVVPPFLPLLPSGEERAGERWGQPGATPSGKTCVSLSALPLLVAAPMNRAGRQSG